MFTILKCNLVKVVYLVRSAGTSAQLSNKEEKYAILKMPSGELRKVLINCYATVGVTSNSDHNLESMGKAGRNRWKGIVQEQGQ
jgi:large subunit ribosomal protein L2